MEPTGLPSQALRNRWALARLAAIGTLFVLWCHWRFGWLAASLPAVEHALAGMLGVLCFVALFSATLARVYIALVVFPLYVTTVHRQLGKRSQLLVNQYDRAHHSWTPLVRYLVAAAIALVLAEAACLLWRASRVEVIIRNLSGVRLSAVTVEALPDHFVFEAVEPGKTEAVHFRASHQQKSVSFSFKGPDGVQRGWDDTYVEADTGYRERITIGKGLQISVTEQIGSITGCLWGCYYGGDASKAAAK